MSEYAPINKIIPFSLVDGPGSRCSIFLQGCNIACLYCHNPETQRACVSCGVCVDTCPARALSLHAGKVIWDEAACVGCDNCIRVCPNYSTPKIRLATAEQVFSEVQTYMPFIRGITVSGGECMLVPEFLLELFSLVRKIGLTTLIDSNGTIPFEDYPELMEQTNGVMLDVKAWDESVARALTGQNAEQTSTVKQNLVYLANAGKLEELRLVCVPNYNDPEAVLKGCAELLGKHVEHTKLKLIRFRPFGVKGELARASQPDDDYMDALVREAREVGFKELLVS